jgi:hypothetical protein
LEELCLNVEMIGGTIEAYRGAILTGKPLDLHAFLPPLDVAHIVPFSLEDASRDGGSPPRSADCDDRAIPGNFQEPLPEVPHVDVHRPLHVPPVPLLPDVQDSHAFPCDRLSEPVDGEGAQGLDRLAHVPPCDHPRAEVAPGIPRIGLMVFEYTGLTEDEKKLAKGKNLARLLGL